MLMTVLGIAGCISLIIMGIGIRDSLSATIRVQLEELYRYDVSSIYNTEASQADLKSYEKVIATHPDIKSSLQTLGESIELSQTGRANKNLSLIVPRSPELLNDFIYIEDPAGNPLTATDDGVILSQKIAEVEGVKIGDEITLMRDSHTYTARVAAINQWYMGHQIIMSPTYYQMVFGQQPEFDSYYINVRDSENLTAILSALNDEAANTLTMRLGATTDIVRENMDGLNLVMVVLLLLAILLAVIVLYNLTNINISERIRELSTIKVLGFYPKEVTLYIYRETLILTVIGIIVGWGLGTMLEQFIIIQIPPAEIMFHRDIYWTNYAVSSCITFAISLAVMLVMHRKLKRVDMIEALKSVE